MTLAQSNVEYGILIAAIAIIVLAGLGTFGSRLAPWFSLLAGRMTSLGT